MVDIDVRGVQTAQLLLKRLAEKERVGLIAERQLGGQQNLLPERLDGLADNILRFLVAVVVGGIEIVDAELITTAEHGDGQRTIDMAFLVGRQTHTAKAERRDRTDFSKRTILHMGFLLLSVFGRQTIAQLPAFRIADELQFDGIPQRDIAGFNDIGGNANGGPFVLAVR